MSAQSEMSPEPLASKRPSAGRIAMVGAGVIFLAIGAYALLSQVALDTLPNMIVWLAGGLILHDVVIAAVVAAVGFVLGRWLPDGVRQIVAGGLIVAGIIALVALPVVIGGGRTPSNPTLLPLDYSRNLLIVVVIIGAITGCLVAIRLVRSRGVQQSGSPSTSGTD